MEVSNWIVCCILYFYFCNYLYVLTLPEALLHYTTEHGCTELMLLTGSIPHFAKAHKTSCLFLIHISLSPRLCFSLSFEASSFPFLLLPHCIPLVLPHFIHVPSLHPVSIPLSSCLYLVSLFMCLYKAVFIKV